MPVEIKELVIRVVVGDDRDVLDEMSADLFKMVSSGKVHIPIDQRYPLAEARQAHIDLEGRKTTGSTILLP